MQSRTARDIKNLETRAKVWVRMEQEKGKYMDIILGWSETEERVRAKQVYKFGKEKISHH